MPTPKEAQRPLYPWCQTSGTEWPSRPPRPSLNSFGPVEGKLTTAEEAMAQYERDRAVLSSSSVEVRELL